MVVGKPRKSDLLEYDLTPELVEKIEQKINRISNRTYIFPYVPSCLVITFLMIAFAVAADHLGPALAGLMLGIGITGEWPEKLRRRIVTSKEKRIIGIKKYIAFKSSESSYEFESARYIAQIERHRLNKEKQQKRKQYKFWMEIEPWEFEKEIAILFEKQGYTAEVTKKSRDGGIDIFLTLDGKRGVVQCRRFKSKVGPGPVRDLYGTMVAGRYSYGFLVCPSGFSNNAYEFSRGKNIKLIGLKRIMELVESNPV